MTNLALGPNQEVDGVSLPAEASTAIATLSRLVDTSTSIPILSAMRVAIANGKATFTVTDVDVRVEYVTAAGEGAFDAAIPAVPLRNAVKSSKTGCALRSATVHALAGVEIIAGDLRVGLRTFDSAEFPAESPYALPSAKVRGSGTVALADLVATLESARVATSSDSWRGAVLCGVAVRLGARPSLLTPEGASLTATGTNGERLICAATPLAHSSITSGESVEVIVPRSFVRAVKALRADRGAIAAIDLSDTVIRCRVGAYTVHSRLIDGSYPRFEAISAPAVARCLLKRADFVAALTDIRKQTSKRAQVSASIADGYLTLTAGGNLTRRVRSEGTFLDKQLPVDNVVAILAGLRGELVAIETAEGRLPVRMSDAMDASTLALLMPGKA